MIQLPSEKSKKQRGKRVLILLALWACSMTVGTGFASWSINTIITDFYLNADSVVFSSNLAVRQDSIETLRYYNTGYLDEDGYICDSTAINVEYSVDVPLCKTKLEGSSLVLHYTVDYASAVDFNLFAPDANHSFTHAVASGNSDITITSTAANGQGNKTYCFDIEIEDLLLSELTEYPFTVTFTFAASPGTYFLNNVFPCLESTDIRFGYDLEGAV